MSSIGDEIQQLQLKIIELEKKQKEDNENNKKTSLDHNFKVINDMLSDKKTKIEQNRYSKSVPLARYYDQELVTHLEAIYNILHVLNNKISELENNNNLKIENNTHSF